MIVARQFLVAGRVQGVGFRFFARAAALHEGLAGFVRNLDDGRVEARAEGDREAIDRFERALREGPPGAVVQQIAVAELAPAAGPPHFQILVTAPVPGTGITQSWNT